MAGVALVGLSGSLIKDTLKESPLGNLLSSGNSSPEPVDKPEPTTVLVGELPYATFRDHIRNQSLLGVFFILFAQIL
jgi:hypothetical protein